MSHPDDDAPASGAPAEDPIPHSRFSVDGAPVGKRYELWHDSIACIFDVDAPRETRNERFSALLDAHMLGPIMLARTQSLAQAWARSPAVMGRDGMDHYMIQFFESGHTACNHRHGATVSPKGGLIVFDLAEPVTSWTTDFRNLSLILPRHMLEGMLRRPDEQHMRALASNEPLVALLRDHMLSLQRLAGQMTVAQAREIAPATAGIVAACLNGSQEDISLGAGRPTLREASVLARCRRFVEANLSSPELGPEAVAAAVGVSRTRLYALFREQGGIAGYIRHRRLRGALAALVSADQQHRSILDIALAFGFSSNAVFTRLFREHYGVTPREVRQGARSGSLTPETIGEEIDHRYEGWLNRLSV